MYGSGSGCLFGRGMGSMINRGIGPSLHCSIAKSRGVQCLVARPPGRATVVLSQQVMSPTPPARVIVTVFYQPTLLHVRVSITQLGARVERVCCCYRELAYTRHIFSDVEGLQCITDHPEFVGACMAMQGR